MAQEKKISVGDFESGLQTGLVDADARRADALEGLQFARRGVGNGLRREQARLTAKYGADHPRVTALRARAVFNEGMIKDLVLETSRARTDIPTVDENTWVLHGYVRDANANGLPNLTVALYDESGDWVRKLGYACTEQNGYFRIRNSTNAIREGRPVYLHVLSNRSEHL